MGLLKKTSLLIFAFFTLVAGGHARASSIGDSVALSSTSALIYDGLSFQISSCTYTLNGAVESSCSVSNDVLEISASNRGTPTIEIIGNSGSAALSCTNCTGSTSLDVTIKVKRASSKASTITTVSNAITGTASTSVTSKLYYPTATLLSTENGSTALSSGAVAVTNGLTGTSSSMSFTVDLGLAADNTGVLALSTDRLNFSPAPEPTTLALLCAGLVGLTAARGRSKGNRGSGAVLDSGR